MRRGVAATFASLALLMSVGVQSVQAGTLAAAHTARESVVKILPPPAVDRPMVWSRGSARARLPASRGRVVIGLERVRDVRRLHAPLHVVSELPGLRAVEVAGPSAALRTLLASPPHWIRYAEPLDRLAVLGSPNDPLLSVVDPGSSLPYEWNFAHLGVDRALSINPGNPGILVGYVDSGVAAVPDLAGQVAESWYLPSQTSNALDVEGHGTFVASIIASRANDDFGLAGFCGLCRLVPFKLARLDATSVALAIQKLVDAHVRVINLSIGGPNPSSVIRDAISYAIRAGVLVVAASGNEGRQSVSYPAAYLQSANGQLGYGLAVGATDAAGNRAFFSNWGTALSLTAPGSYDSRCELGVIGALPPHAPEFEEPSACARTFRDAAGNLYAYASGTSFSAPEVAGIAALIWSARPSMKNYEVADLLEQTATRGEGIGWAADRGWGVVNAAAAMARVSHGSGGNATVGSTPTAGAAVRLSGLRVRGAKKAGGVMVASAVVTSPGDSPPAIAAFRCAVTLGDGVVKASTRSNGAVAECTWKNPSRSAGARGAVLLRIRSSDGGSASASATFRLRNR